MLEKLKKEVYRANMLLVERNLVINTWGNVSGIDRDSGLVVIKPSGVEYSDLSPIDLPVLDLNGNVVKYLYNTTSSAGTAWFPKSSGNQLRAIVQNNRTLDKSGNAIYTEDIVVATLNYNSAYYLTSIVSPGRTLAFSYDSSHYLTKVSVSEYLNSKTTATTYDLAQYGYTDGILTDVYDVERQYGVHYDFTDGKCSSYYEFAGTISSPHFTVILSNSGI